MCQNSRRISQIVSDYKVDMGDTVEVYHAKVGGKMIEIGAIINNQIGSHSGSTGAFASCDGPYVVPAIKEWADHNGYVMPDCKEDEIAEAESWYQRNVEPIVLGFMMSSVVIIGIWLIVAFVWTVSWLVSWLVS